MCSMRQIISPFGELYKHQKIADPLGLTKTVVGDPTGQIRRARQEDKEIREGVHWTMQSNGQLGKRDGFRPQPKTVLGA